MSFVLLLDCLAYYTPSLKSKIHFKMAIKNYNIVFFLLLSFPHKLKNSDFNYFYKLKHNKFYILIIQTLTYYKYISILKSLQKIGCKTCFCDCMHRKKAVSLSSLTKQHNLFYTLKN